MGPRIAFFGSSLVSSYWNGAATYYRGLIKALSGRGWQFTFFEPDVLDRQRYRDIADPPWAKVVVYDASTEEPVHAALEAARDYDIVVKASGVGVFDRLLERAVPSLKADGRLAIFWDVDAPATLARVHADQNDPFLEDIPKYDLIFTYGGGSPVIAAYRRLGARAIVPVYNAADLDTHHPVPADACFDADAALLANRLPDREARIEEFFFRPARALGDRTFLLGGNGWDQRHLPPNVRALGHVPTADHNRFNCTPAALVSVNRTSMADTGYSPATRMFEAAAAGACLITDAWAGIEEFFAPGREILVARSGDEVADLVRGLSKDRARQIGQAALTRVVHEHTYEHRAQLVEQVVGVTRHGAIST